MPIPEEVTLIGGGYLAYGGFNNLVLTLMVCFLGVILGDFIVFSLGKRLGNGIIKHPISARFISEKRFNQARKFFSRHGSKTVFFARFISGFRIVTFATAGTLRMKASRFITVNILAAMISVPMLVLIGYTFGTNIDFIFHILAKANSLIVFSLLFIVSITVTCYFWKKREVS